MSCAWSEGQFVGALVLSDQYGSREEWSVTFHLTGTWGTHAQMSKHERGEACKHERGEACKHE
eukprot:4973124-Pleurochrysis_carterae.AAC.1